MQSYLAFKLLDHFILDDFGLHYFFQRYNEPSFKVNGQIDLTELALSQLFEYFESVYSIFLRLLDASFLVRPNLI